jgi:hypothetical protein
MLDLLPKNAIHRAGDIKYGFHQEQHNRKQVMVSDSTPNKRNTRVAFHSFGRFGVTQISGCRGDF